MRGRYAEGRAWYAEVLELARVPEHASLQSRALVFAGHLAYCEGEAASASALLDTARRIAQAAGDEAARGLAAHFLGNVARLRGDLAEAERQYTQALDIAQRTGSAWRVHEVTLIAMLRFEAADVAGARARIADALALCAMHDIPQARARALALSARLAALDGDQATAADQFEMSLNLLKGLRDQQGLGYAHLLAGDAALEMSYHAAAEHFAQVLTIARDTHDQPALARGFEGVACFLATTEPARAVRLAATAGALRESLGIELTPVDRARLARRLPEHATPVAAPERGRTPTVEMLVQSALQDALSACAALQKERPL